MAGFLMSQLSVPLEVSPMNQSLIMPKLSFRFRVTLQNFGISSSTVELTKQIMNCSRPKPDFDPVSLSVYNSTVNLLGKPKWGDISIKIRDDASNAVAKVVGEQLQKQFDFMEQASAASAADYKFQTIIEVLDGGNGSYTPNVIESWTCYGCILKGVDYSELDYGKNEAMDIGLSIMIDNAIQSPVGVGVGTQIARNVIGTIA